MITRYAQIKNSEVKNIIVTNENSPLELLCIGFDKLVPINGRTEVIKMNSIYDENLDKFLDPEE